MRLRILALAALGFMGSFSGCAYLQRIPGAPPRDARAADAASSQAAQPAAPGQLDAIQLTPSAAGSRQPKATLAPTKVIQVSESDPIRSLERQLPQLKGDRVVIPTALLRTLMATQKLTDGQCKDLSVQLEALKNIDLEETEIGAE